MKRKALLFSSLLISLTATFILYEKIHKAEIHMEKGKKRGRIIVAGKKLNPGETFDSTTVKTLSIPEEDIFSRMVREKEFPLIKGAGTKNTIEKGEPVTWEDIEDPVSLSRFSKIITKGMRAITIPAGDEGTFSGLLTPGDHVDVYLSYINRGEYKDRTFLLLTDRVVAAVGSHYGKMEEGEQNPVSVSSATLLLSPLQAECLLKARENSSAKISLILRNPKEKKKKKRHPVRKRGPRQIEIYRRGILFPSQKIY